MKAKQPKAIVLLSGGLDSATILYYALRRDHEVSGLIFSYGQRHVKEIEAAKRIAELAGCDYEVVRITLPWQGSSLLDTRQELPRHDQVDPRQIPSTYVPARNIIFLSFAASFAEAVGAETIFIGANAIDYSGYPDCRPEFFRAYQQVLKKGLKTGIDGRPIRIQAPLLRKTKAQIIRLGLRLKVPYEETWSCYAGGRRPCGVCDSCLLRRKGFAAVGMEDPAEPRSG